MTQAVAISGWSDPAGDWRYFQRPVRLNPLVKQIVWIVFKTDNNSVDTIEDVYTSLDSAMAAIDVLEKANPLNEYTHEAHEVKP